MKFTRYRTNIGDPKLVRLGAVHISQASPAKRADLWLKDSGEPKLKGIAVLGNVKACHQAK